VGIWYFIAILVYFKAIWYCMAILVYFKARYLVFCGHSGVFRGHVVLKCHFGSLPFGILLPFWFLAIWYFIAILVHCHLVLKCHFGSWPFGILLPFWCIWCIWWQFGIFVAILVYYFKFWFVAPRKIWQPCSGLTLHACILVGALG
jgi:hypothetical protein